jgi:S-adenosylmethionine decarboxylase
MKSAMIEVGTEWLIDAAGCRAESLRDLSVLRTLCDHVLATLELQVIGQAHWHQFPGAGGVTGLYLLTESHLACHTYPEVGVATFNLYCCRRRPAWPWDLRLREALGAKKVTVRALVRTGGNPEGGRP